MDAAELQQIDDGEIVRLAEGLCYASVCAPAQMSGDDASIAYSMKFGPAGTTRGWGLCDDPTFKDGQPNGCPCDQFPDQRRHWLLSC